MLVARMEDGNLIYLTAPAGREELRGLRSNHVFQCADCGNRVLLKVGDIKTPHFAHKSSISCGASEPESFLHIQGKIQLHEFFSRKNIPVELERYVPEIRQRADLLINQRMAIEFQCSPIPAAEILKRSAWYTECGLDYMWIGGSKEVVKNAGVETVKLKEYQKEMLQLKGGMKYLLVYNPISKQFHYFSNLFYIHGGNWTGKVTTLSSQKQTYPFATPKELGKTDFNAVYAIFMDARSRYIRSQLYAKKRYQNALWLLCYELQLNIKALPLTIGVPVIGAECMVEHPVVWQLKIWRARKKGVSASEMLSTGEFLLKNPEDAEQAKQIIDDYSSFLEASVHLRVHPTEYSDALYEIYCKNVRKLRK